MANRPKAVIVHSFPRSGTHITIDFIRRNLVGFSPRLNFWESSSKLYLGLDERLLGTEPKTIPRYFQGKHLIAKSHHIEFPVSRRAEVDELLRDYEIFEIYPFRNFASTIKSFAAYSHYEGPVFDFLNEREPFFKSGLTVKRSVYAHAERALAGRAVFLNVERLLANPDRAADALGRYLGANIVHIERRLPRRRLYLGRIGEIAERLLNARESTEVRTRFQNTWAHDTEHELVNDQFADLHDELVKRQLVHVDG